MSVSGYATRASRANEDTLRGLETALIDYALAEVRCRPERAATLKALLPPAVEDCLEKIIAIRRGPDVGADRTDVHVAPES